MNQNLQGLMAYKTMRAIERQTELMEPDRPRKRRSRLVRFLDRLLGA